MSNNIKYEIHGLKAIAVGLIILYNSKLTIFGHQPFIGGFVGIDIFFVISGYLITSIILKELITTGSFSLKYFYERQVRRVFPIFLIVILVSLPFAWIYLLPSYFVDFSKSIITSLSFSSNFYFFYTANDLLILRHLPKPFFHTWFLSTLAQFYLIFPIILIIIYKYFKQYLIYIFILGLVISLGLSEWTSKNNPSISFYFLHTRMWELLSGSIMAYFEITRGYRSNYKTLNLILPSVGVILISGSVFFLDDKMSYPSFFILPTVIGACLIIWFSSKDELITKILSSKLFVGIGLISYSLYLWHYPIFSFNRVAFLTEDKVFLELFLGLLILIISVIFYYLIEQPAKKEKYKFKIIVFLISIAIGIIFIFMSYILSKNGKLNKVNIMIEKQIESPLFSSECKYSSSNSSFLTDIFFQEKFENCKKKYGKFILIIGDSQSLDLFNSISKISKKSEFIIGLNKPGCRPFAETNKDCHYINALDFIEKNNENIKYIFFTHRGGYLLTSVEGEKNNPNRLLGRLPLNDLQINKTINYLKLIKGFNKNLILVGPHLEPNIVLNRYSIINRLNGNQLNDYINYDLLKVDEQLKKISRVNNIDYVSKIEVINFDLKRDFSVDGVITFSDTNHWSSFGEIYFGKKLIFNSKIKNILFP